MTVKDYLITLPEPHRSRALKYENEDFYKEVDNLESAIDNFDYWSTTDERALYWLEVSKGNYSKALELCPITPEEQHLIEDLHNDEVVNVIVYTKQNPIDWLYLQYEIYGYLTPQMVEKAKQLA